MWSHSQLGNLSFQTSRKLFNLIKKGKIQFAGNSKLRIYGLMNCSSGKRMKQQNRVFFSSETEAVNNGYRPCGHCMRAAYQKWKEFGATALR